MSLKKLGIVLCIFTSIIVGIIVVFACVKTDPNLQMNKPAKYIVYNNSSAGKTITQEEKSSYEKLTKGIENCFKVNIFNTLASRKEVGYKPSQDIKNVYPTFSKSSSTVYVEMVFDKIQTMIVEIDGDTRAIDYFSLIFEVKDSNRVKEIAIYHSSTTNQKYTTSPILVLGKQNKLYDLIFELSK